MGKWSINRAPTKNNTSRKETVTGSRLDATKKQRVSADLLQTSMNSREECGSSELESFKRQSYKAIFQMGNSKISIPSVN